MKMGLLCCLNWILIFRISFHLLKTQLQKCFIKPCFKKDHVWFVFLKTIFPEWYTPYKKKDLNSLAIIPLLVQHWHGYHVPYSHPSSVFSLPWVHPLVFLHSLSKSFLSPEICASFGCTQKLLLVPLLSALQSWGIWWLLCWPSPPSEMILALGGSPIDHKPLIIILHVYHQNSRVGWWLCRWQIDHLIMGFYPASPSRSFS